MQWAAATKIIEQAEDIVVIGHIRPDADAIGSVCAAVAAFRSLGKRAFGCIGDQSPLSENLLSIPGAADILLVSELPVVDAVVLVDCATVDRAGACAHGVEKHDAVVVVDHHASNPGFGHVNLIDSAAESTTTILTEWFSYLGVELTPEIAHALYAGLATDTGSFRWGRPEMHELAAQLMRCGVDNRKVGMPLLDVQRVADLQLLGTVLSKFRVEQARYSLGVLWANYETIHGYSTNSVESLVEFVRALDGVDVGVVLKEYAPNVWAVSLRSMHVNVAEIATGLGGGGHIRAAGYTAYGTPDEVFTQLIDFLETV
ncbi:DHH family phosphoesterase [Corynebacterium freiburgense]|uniref:DHH family phosphoesterase n=1 Tax=Corynebacterium freiburgense TaxID=556548 RepID=UPI00041CE643|nr:bifunctional oligoribonuclease/PAP phosphatase NrnA [Corynebacterium freiburgense]WJZ02955.1 Bifunctional oligoribonuclease and PAP phosphatase NrnA [Corynebacterium freiburgense]